MLSPKHLCSKECSNEENNHTLFNTIVLIQEHFQNPNPSWWLFSNFHKKAINVIIFQERLCSLPCQKLHILIINRKEKKGGKISFSLCTKFDSMNDLGTMWELFWIGKNARKIMGASDCNFSNFMVFLIYLRLLFCLFVCPWLAISLFSRVMIKSCHWIPPNYKLNSQCLSINLLLLRLLKGFDLQQAFS